MKSKERLAANLVLNLGCGKQTYGNVRIDLYHGKVNLLADVEKSLPEHLMGLNPTVSIIIPTYDRKRELIRLVKSIKQSNYPEENIEIIVVDDASTDGTYAAIKSKFPDVKVFRNVKPKMASGTRNIGIKASKGDYLFFVDPDNVIDRKTISELVGFMERSNKNLGLAGPIMYYYSAPREIWCAGGRLRRPLYIQTHIFQYKKSEMLPKTKIYAIKCEYIPNAFMVRRQIVKEVGFFDEKNFPIQWEDIDFSLRIKQKGYEIVVVPQAKIWHDVSTAKDFHINEERAFFRGRSRARFYLKYAPVRILLLPIDALGFCGVLFAYDRGSRRLKRLFQYFKGLIYGIVLRDSTNQYKKAQP